VRVGRPDIETGRAQAFPHSPLKTSHATDVKKRRLALYGGLSARLPGSQTRSPFFAGIGFESSNAEKVKPPGNEHRSFSEFPEKKTRTIAFYGVFLGG
jgi:hypothetical protein